MNREMLALSFIAACGFTAHRSDRAFPALRSAHFLERKKGLLAMKPSESEPYYNRLG